MDNKFYLMRKNEIITLVQFNENGDMTAFSKNIPESSKDLAPLAYHSTTDTWLIQWWANRTIPLTRDQLATFLKAKGFSTAGQYLVQNLGLSLTDYYWIKPIDSSLTWEKVNLYDNPFHEDVFLSRKEPESDGIPRYTPNGSLQGNIEKTWTISEGKRYLIKGNQSTLSTESINEVIASRMHELQGYDNYTDYKLIHIKDKQYKFGCIAEAFTSQHLELISALDIITSEPLGNKSYRSQFIEISKKYGIDEEQLIKDIDYQIMCDFVMTNYDRHLTNIGVLRDADTLKFIRMAPIYDSGNSMFAKIGVPKDIKALQKIEINSFTKKESAQLKLVHDRTLLDLNKLPSADYIRDMYHKDDYISDSYVKERILWYERKIDMLDKWQHGKDLYSIQKDMQNQLYPVSSKYSQTLPRKMNCYPSSRQ